MNLAEGKIWDFLESCNRAGIKNPVSFLLSKRPQIYDWLKGAFPRGILPTDIDGEVEVNGYFMRFEFKDERALRNGIVPRGQRIALERLSLTKRFTVLIVGQNDLGEITCYETLHHNGKRTPLQDGNKEDIRCLCGKWAQWAQKQQI